MGFLCIVDAGCLEVVNKVDCVAAVLAFDISFPRMLTISSLRPFSIHI